MQILSSLDPKSEDHNELNATPMALLLLLRWRAAAASGIDLARDWAVCLLPMMEDEVRMPRVVKSPT